VTIGSGDVFPGAVAIGATRAAAPASLSRDGRTLAVIRDRRVELWHPSTGRLEKVPDIRGAVSVAFIGDGKRLVVATGQRRVLLVRGASKARRLGAASGLAAVSADGRYLATAHRKTLRVRAITHPNAGTPVELPFTPGSLEFSPKDSGLLAIARPFANEAVMWRWRDRQPPPSPQGRRGGGAAVLANCFDTTPTAFSAERRLLVMSGIEGGVSAWSAGGARRFSLPRAPGCPSVVRIDADRRRILVARGSVATVYNGHNGRPLVQLSGHTKAITDAAFSPSGGTIATAAADGSARVWDTDTGVQLFDLRGRGLFDRVAPLASVAFTPDGRFVMTADDDGVARLWSVSTGTRRLGRWSRTVTGAAFTNDGQVTASVAGGRIVSLPVDGGALRVVRPRRRNFVPYTLLSADATHAVEVRFGRRRPTLLWTAVDDQRSRRIANAGFRSISLSQDGRAVLVWGPRRLWVWHDEGPSTVVPLHRQERRNGSFAELSKNGQRLLVTTFRGGARILDVDGGRSVPLRDPAATDIAAADFSPDGAQLVTAGTRGAYVWDASTGRLDSPLGDNPGSFSDATFSRPDGREIATVDRNGVVRIFDAASRTETSALPPRPGASYYGLEFHSPTRTALVQADRGLELRVCDGCRTLEWLDQHVERRVTRTADEVREFIRKAKEG
jgi:WD40 repeat protein